MSRAAVVDHRYAQMSSHRASCYRILLLVSLLGLFLLISLRPVNASSGEPPFALGWSSFESEDTRSVAWGDYDRDGNLDLAVGNWHEVNRLYRNDVGTLTASAVWSSAESDDTTSVAWGDYDGDGYLDLAVGSGWGPIRLYHNDRDTLTSTAAWSSAEGYWADSVVWGDYDGDGNLDLAISTETQAYRLYRNDTIPSDDAPIFTLASSSDAQDFPNSVAWGDYDGDGDLDLAVGNNGTRNQLYRNDRGVLTTSPVWWSAESDHTYSVTWGDYDGDGDLDLAVGNNSTGTGHGEPNRLYRNDGGVLTDSAVWSSAETDNTNSVAWGDYDGDSDLDLAVGNGYPGQRNRLYRNDGIAPDGTPIFNLAWSSVESENTYSVAWGDYDGDGDLDLAAGNGFGWVPNRLYRNDGGTLTTSAVWSPLKPDSTYSTAWGDYDGDGDLDLAVGNGGYYNAEPSRLYRNDGGILTVSPVWSSAESDNTLSVAWGDYDNDGDLDLAVGNYGQGNRLYRNDGIAPDGTPSFDLAWSSDEADYTWCVAWGDYDGDGDLDLAVGSTAVGGGSIRLYRNAGGVLTASAVWSSVENVYTASVVWGDYDGDGDLDLAAGNSWGRNHLYRNDGIAPDDTPIFNVAWSSVESDQTLSAAWGDYDGDGNLDLVVGNYNQPNRLYRNDDGVLTASAVWVSVESGNASVAWGDYDGDGDLDLAASNRLYRNDGGRLTSTAAESTDSGGQVAWGDYNNDGNLDLAVGNRLFANIRNARSHPGLPGNATPPAVRLVRPTPPGNAGYYSAPNVWPAVGGTIPISYTLSQPDSRPVSYIRAYYSLDGGGRWLPAAAASGTITTNLATSSTGLNYIYNWDVSASGLFGQSDNVVFRIVAAPDLRAGPNSVPGPYLRGSNASDTYPFRVRGTQVRVMEGGAPAAGALVYRLPAGQAQAGDLMRDPTKQPFKTDRQGYLQGRGTIGIGDRLLALAPVTATVAYTLYHTNATPTAAGLDTDIVQQSGVQTLTVSSSNPLMSFDLDVSLEWDASNEPGFLARLQTDLVKASRTLYDWTNGQVALGRVTIYQAKEKWAEADVQVLASNQVRPNSARGGIVSVTTTLTLTAPVTVTVAPGAVRIGPTWNRYGNVEIIGEDWPRVLAHELAHYALFLEDTYIGLDKDGLLVPISTCGGTAMSDPYLDGASELRWNDPLDNWFEDCDASLAEEPEWDILTQVYPALHAPPPTNGGPNAMPFALAQIEIKEPPPAGAALLDDANVQLEDPDLKLAGGRAFLVHPDVELEEQRVVDLGRPVGGTVLARGAREGDELCIFAANAFACKTLSNTVPALLAPQAAWRPEITVTPVNTTTLRIQTGRLDGASSLILTIYPGGEAFAELTLQPSHTQTITLAQPATDVFLDFSGSSAGQRLIAGYWLGSGPGRTYSYGGPYTSGDGGVSVYPPGNLATDDFMVLQTPLAMPVLPPGRVLIGRAYEVRAGSGASVFTGGSVTFQYLGLDVLLSGIPERYLKIYASDGRTWKPLRTVLNTAQNFASAPLPGPGIYALLVGTEIPLTGPGWNQFGYTIQETLPVTVALRSIDGYYTTVYGYDPMDPHGDPWKIYSVGAPDWVNELRQLEYARGYWIQATDAITLYLGGGGDAPAAGTANLLDPPATYYGPVSAGRDFAPAAGMPVRAYIDGRLCGQGETQVVDGQIVYTIDVDAGSGGSGGCGVAGHPVQFEVGAQRMNGSASWDNDRVQRLALDPAAPPRLLYLPMLLGAGTGD